MHENVILLNDILCFHIILSFSIRPRSICLLSCVRPNITVIYNRRGLKTTKRRINVIKYYLIAMKCTLTLSADCGRPLPLLSFVTNPGASGFVSYYFFLRNRAFRFSSISLLSLTGCIVLTICSVITTTP